MLNCAWKRGLPVIVMTLALYACGGASGEGGESAALSPFIQSDTTTDPGPWGGESVLMFTMTVCGDANAKPVCSPTEFRKKLRELGIKYTKFGWEMPLTAWDDMDNWIRTECLGEDGIQIDWVNRRGSSIVSVFYDGNDVKVNADFNPQCPDIGQSGTLQ